MAERPRRTFDDPQHIVVQRIQAHTLQRFGEPDDPQRRRGTVHIGRERQHRGQPRRHRGHFRPLPRAGLFRAQERTGAFVPGRPAAGDLPQHRDPHARPDHGRKHPQCPDDVHRAAAAAESNRREHVRERQHRADRHELRAAAADRHATRIHVRQEPPDDVRGQRRFGDHEFRG